MLWYNETQRLAIISALQQFFSTIHIQRNFFERMEKRRAPLYAPTTNIAKEYVTSLVNLDLQKIQTIKKYLRDDVQLLHVLVESRRIIIEKKIREPKEIQNIIAALRDDALAIQNTQKVLSLIISTTKKFSKEQVFWKKLRARYDENYALAITTDKLALISADHRNHFSKILDTFSKNNVTIEIRVPDDVDIKDCQPNAAQATPKLFVYDSKIMAATLSVATYDTQCICLGAPEIYIQGNGYVEKAIETILAADARRKVQIDLCSDVQHMLRRITTASPLQVQKVPAAYSFSIL